MKLSDTDKFKGNKLTDNGVYYINDYEDGKPSGCIIVEITCASETYRFNIYYDLLRISMEVTQILDGIEKHMKWYNGLPKKEGDKQRAELKENILKYLNRTYPEITTDGTYTVLHWSNYNYVPFQMSGCIVNGISNVTVTATIENSKYTI
jgi:hypothetical protein